MMSSAQWLSLNARIDKPTIVFLSGMTFRRLLAGDIRKSACLKWFEVDPIGFQLKIE
jgi:hypothetical protein